MGIELLIGAAVAAASVATGVMQMNQAKKANAAREKANQVTNANQKNEQRASTRRAFRENRIRRAMILQQAENTGTSASSGALGALGVTNTNFGTAVADSSRQTTAITGINNLNQQAANYDYKAARIGAFGSMFSNALGGFQKAYS